MKKVTSYFLVFLIVLMTSLPFSSKSEAAVGILIKSRTTRVVGGIAAIGGYVFANVIYTAAVNSGATWWAAYQIAIVGSIYTTIGIAVGVVGLVVLDGKTASDFKFLPLDEKLNPAREVKIFNQEIDQLNAIKETIEEEVDLNPKADTIALWNHYSYLVSPETMTVARAVAQSFLKQTQRVR